MISLYSGTPGSGKSLHVAKDIYFNLKSLKKTVIATFPFATEKISVGKNQKLGKYIYIDYSRLTVEYLINYAKKHHVLGKESQTLVVIDECQIMYNPREFNRTDRLNWITFFTQHRKLGYDFILITQNDRLVDRQIRSLFEYEVKHIKTNNMGTIGMMLPFSMFLAKKYFYCIKEVCSTEFFIYSKKYGSLYDTFMFFDESVKV